MERLTALVSGKVQGVAYRYFAVEHAERHGLVGTVRNLKDGKVEVVAEGPRAALETFLKELERGPLFARVTGIDAQWSRADGEFDAFALVRDEW
jgi:acylphosphatase